MQSPLYRAFAKLFRYPWLVLGVLTILIGLLIIQIPRLSLDASADSLVLEGDPTLDLYREVSKRYQSESILVVTYTPNSDLYSDTALNQIASLRDELRSVPGVSSVTTILDVPLLYSPPVKLRKLSRDIRYLSQQNVDRNLARHEFQNSPLYKNLLTSQDENTTALQITLSRDETFFQLLALRDELRLKRNQAGLNGHERRKLKDAESDFKRHTILANEKQRELVASVRDVLNSYRPYASIFLGGVPMIAVDMITFIESDLAIFSTGIVLFIIIMMTVIFRRLRWVLLPLTTCLITTLSMLGFLAWTNWQLTVISSNFTALLLIITLAISIHLVVRYREYHTTTPEATQKELVFQTLTFMAKPCFYTALTTIVAFASLVFSGIRPVIDFGWIMTLGVIAALLMTFTVLPVGLLLMSKEKTESVYHSKPITHYCARITDKHGTLILILSSILLIISIAGITRLKVENRFIDYFHDTTEIYQGMIVIDRKLGGTIPLDIIIASPNSKTGSNNINNDKDSEPDNGLFGDIFSDDAEPESDNYWFSRSGLDELEYIHAYLESLDETGKVLSLSSLYQVIKDITDDDIDDFQLALIRKSLPENVKKLLISPYLSPQGDETRLSIRVMETSHELKRDALLKQINTFMFETMGFEPGQVRQTGMLVLYNNMLQSLFASQITTLGVVFIAITLMFSVLFKSLYLAMIAVTPNLLAAGIVLGFMGWSGIPLDMMTITIAAITVGIGVDNTIHYIHRFKKEFPKDQDYRATMYRCHNSIGKAMFYTSVIIIAGFSILALSNFTPTIYFGLLTGLAMCSALIGALFLLPQLLISLKPKITI